MHASVDFIPRRPVHDRVDVGELILDPGPANDPWNDGLLHPRPQLLRRHGKFAAFALAHRWMRRIAAPALKLALMLAPALLASSAEAAGGLAQLPHPFIDQAAQRPFSIPIVYRAHPEPEPDEVKAAAIVASWLGSFTDGRGARFPVQSDLPSGNALVIARRTADLDAQLALPAAPRALIAVRDNPRNASARLLIIAGDSAADLLAAAITLTTRNLAAVRTDVLAAGQADAPHRAQYDAPRWLDTAKPAAIVSSVRDRPKMVGSGSIDVSFRLPPDLFLSARRSVPLHLRLEYGGVSRDGRALAHVRLNGQPVRTMTLAPAPERATHDAIVPLPSAAFHSYRNTLTIDAEFGGKAPKGVMQFAAIDRDTTLDLRGIPHAVLLPRLELVMEAGYPFTAWPDLSGTAIVMSTRPAAREYETMLNVVGHFGAQTGTAATGVTIVDAAHVDAVRDKDIVLLGTPSSQPLLTEWAARMPLALMRDGSQINSAPEFSHWLHPEWPFRHDDRERLARFVAGGYTFDAVLEHFVSPFRSDRSVVAILPGGEDGGEAAASAFSGNRRGPIYGGLAVSRDGRFESFLLGVAAYQAGSASDYQRALVMVHDHYWLILPAVLLAAFLVPRVVHAGADRMSAAATWLRHNVHVHLPGRRPTIRPF